MKVKLNSSNSGPFSLNFSLDLSLSPKVVGALAPAIERCLQGTGFALGAAEGAGSPNTSSQRLDSSTKQTKAPNKLVSSEEC